MSVNTIPSLAGTPFNGSTHCIHSLAALVHAFSHRRLNASAAAFDVYPDGPEATRTQTFTLPGTGLLSLAAYCRRNRKRRRCANKRHKMMVFENVSCIHPSFYAVCEYNEKSWNVKVLANPPILSGARASYRIFQEFVDGTFAFPDVLQEPQQTIRIVCFVIVEEANEKTFADRHTGFC